MSSVRHDVTSRNAVGTEFVTFNETGRHHMEEPSQAVRGLQPAPISTVTSSEIIATIADKGVMVSPPGIASYSLRNKNAGADGFGSSSPPTDALYSPRSSAIGQLENVAPNRQLNVVQEESSRADHELATAERDLQDLAKLRLKTLEEIIQDKLMVIE